VSTVIKRSSLAPAVATVARYVPAKGSQDALEGILLETFEDANGQTFLRLTGSDGSDVGKTVIAVESGELSRTLVRSDVFASLVRSLPGETVKVEVQEKSLVLSSGAGVFNLELLNEADYPEVARMPKVAGKIDASAFTSAVAQVARAAAAADTQATLSGVRIEVTKENLTLVATDRYRLGRVVVPWQSDVEDAFAAYVPAKALAATASAFANTGEIALGIEPEGSTFGVASGSTAVVLGQLGGEYPAYGKLFANEYATTAEVDGRTLAEVASRVALLTNKDGVLKLSLTQGQISISAAGRGTGAEPIAANVTGDDVAVNVNPHFLADGLSSLKGAKVKIGLNGAQLAVVFSSADEPDAYQYLLMPVRDV
jgi:DNA polymerase-3 subunit beta